MLGQSTSSDEEEKSKTHHHNKKMSSQIQRDALSDDEEQVQAKATVVRKVQMLEIDNSDDEFQLKSGCTRKKSVDFNRERDCRLSKQGCNFDLIRAEEANTMIKIRKQTVYVKKR